MLNSLPYLFIAIYAVLFHDQKLKVNLWYNCSRSLKFNVCGPDYKICIYIENGLFPQFFETHYITVYTVVEKPCDIKYCVNIYTALVLFSFYNVTFPSMFQFLIINGMGFEVLTVGRIYNVVSVRTQCNLVHIW